MDNKVKKVLTDKPYSNHSILAIKQAIKMLKRTKYELAA